VANSNIDKEHSFLPPKLWQFKAAYTLYMKVLNIYSSNTPLSAKQENQMVELSLKVI
jgi:hypothetical protein